jgi:hypothetical protein
MADKLDWLNKHLVTVRYTSISDIIAKENFKLRPDLEDLYAGVDSVEAMVFKLADAGNFKDACELMAYIAHRRAAIWWGYRCVMSLQEEYLVNPAKERDIADIGSNMEPEVPEFAKIELPKPPFDTKKMVDEIFAEIESSTKQANAMLDQGMLKFVESAVEVAFQEFKAVHGIHPVDLLKQIGARVIEPHDQIDPNSPIVLESAKLKAQLAAVQKETVATIKSVLPPKMPAHLKKLSDDALAAVYHWTAAPIAENAQRCLDVGNGCPDQPAGLLSLSAFWSFGNLLPIGDQMVPTPPGLAANGLTQTLLLCALAPGGVRKVKERYAEYFRLGIEVLTGADNWEASLVDTKMPHEYIPNPDWSKASDKSASEWQGEKGITDMPDVEKEKRIAGIIAESKVNGAPVYKRWKME